MNMVKYGIRLSAVLVGLLTTSVQADWAVQAATSDRMDLLEAQAQRMQHHFQNVRIIRVDGTNKLVIGQWQTTRDANATLVAVRQEVPDAFLRKVDAGGDAIATAPVKPAPPVVKAVVPVITETPRPVLAVHLPVYDPNLWVKR